MTPLAALIRDVQNMSEPPLSNGEIARRSGLSRARVQQIMTEKPKAMPDPETLRGLSKGLRVPLRVVVDAALNSVGLPSGEPSVGSSDTVSQMRRIVEDSTAMSEETRAYWLAMVDALEAQIHRRGNGTRAV